MMSSQTWKSWSLRGNPPVWATVLGVPSRMNVGQIFENLLGSAGRWNGEEYRVGAFDEMFADEASRGIRENWEVEGTMEVTRN